MSQPPPKITTSHVDSTIPPSYEGGSYQGRPTTESADELPPPAYGSIYGYIDDEENGTKASVAEDGRVNIRIDNKTRGLSSLLGPALRNQLALSRPPSSPEPYVPPLFVAKPGESPPPPLNIVIHVVGSRGDVQPFVALGKVLKETHGHRVRLATHPVFEKFVTENDLEYFNIGGDPSELMAFMVKNPGLMPGFDTLRRGDIGKRRRDIGEMIKKCWRSCIETGDGTGPEASDNTVEDWASAGNGENAGTQARPFIADAIIANPPSFAHIHCAEKLGIPLHMMFTMPWSPTQAFPHPLANITSTNADPNLTNFMSYALVDMMTWQGLGDVINRFRVNSLTLEPVSLTWAPGMLARLKVPWTYCWSPTLIPKPRDWGPFITLSGFYFLSLASGYTPDPDLAGFLDAGPPPIYIGFGSIVVDDPNGMTKLIFDAVKKTGQRALVSKGWGGFGGDQLDVPEGVFMLGNVPHDWLFNKVSCVIHHGGAGTTAAGIACGKPTVIVPFFGDQPFWGAMVARAGAGPNPVPFKELTADILAASITEALKPELVEKAKKMADSISHEKGTEAGAQYFHHMLDMENLRCNLTPTRAAVWRIKRTQVRLSAFAATVLGNEGLINFNDMKLYRPQEHDVEDEPWDPITGSASALIGTMSSMAMGVADLPIQTLKMLKIHPDAVRDQQSRGSSSQADVSARRPSEQLSSALSPHRRSSGNSAQASRDASRSSSPAGPAVAHEIGESIADGAAQTDTTGSSGGTEQRVNSTAADAKYDVESALGGGPGSSSATDAKATASKEGFDVFSAVETGKGVLRMASAGIKSPMDFTLALARGFHNAPKLYGDESVRKSEKITDFQSGLRAAGKEFGYGMYDGITGLVTQPLEGAKKEGAAGFFKGFGRGIGGIALKPGAAIWGIPGYTSKGIYKELQKMFGPSVENYIIASRTAQGYEEVLKSTPEEREAVIKRWKQLGPQLKKKPTFKDHKDQFFQKKSDIRKVSTPNAEPERNTTTSDPSPPATSVENNTHDAEIEEAIRQSMLESSHGNADEDAMIERAIRASVRELEVARQSRLEDEELHRAIEASIRETGTGSSGGTQGVESSGAKVDVDDDEVARKEDEIVLKYIMRQSLAEEEARSKRGT